MSRCGNSGWNKFLENLGRKIREAALLVTRLLPGVCPRSGVKSLDATAVQELPQIEFSKRLAN
jgi:hypothetical protein